MLGLYSIYIVKGISLTKGHRLKRTGWQLLNYLQYVRSVHNVSQIQVTAFFGY